jgi:hypothetical protein
MSAATKEDVKKAREYLEEAEGYAKAAKKRFESAGDPEGAKIADGVADGAKKGQDYVDERLG